MKLDRNAALVLIDIQNDFCPGGALAVPQGDTVVSIANHLMPYFETVIATQDWHPKNHASFASQHPSKSVGDIIQLTGKPQVLWPDHCVQGSTGANFHASLKTNYITKVFQKGMNASIDSYSAFYDNYHLQDTGLTHWLRAQKISDLYILGLATEYCVKYSCLDAIIDNFSVTLIEDGCRGIDLSPGDIETALKELRSKSVKFTNSTDIIPS